VGDFDQPDSLEAAMAGCDHLYLVSPPSPRQPEQEQNVTDAAKRAGVAHVVKQTVLGADPDAPIAFGRWHGRIEQYLVQSGLAYTLVRPHSFMQNFLLSAQPVAEPPGRPAPAPRLPRRPLPPPVGRAYRPAG
jgi:uncharacterized protein YbjT (DUF2867 family)